jgi:ABC-2 type transport system ATP-binding protein
VKPVEVSQISKSFGVTRAVDNLSFTVERGEIFGLLGPNGAGKTTTIRLMLDIFKPETGTVSILGGPMTEEKKNRIGYMPEERGLYQDIPLERCLTYLGALKGLSSGEVQARLGSYLERFDLAAHKTKKVKELSKGMQQKAQIIAAIMHDPELIIVDEPFASLDPVNTQMVKDLMRELADEGTAIIMSTHQMHQVEELCDRILLINRGREVLYGDLHDIRHQYSGHAVLVRADGDLPSLAGVESALAQNGDIKLTLAEGVSPRDILKRLVEHDLSLEKFEIAIPSLDEIFIRVVGKGEE